VTLVSLTAQISNAVTLLADGEKEESPVVTDKTFATNCQDVTLSINADLVSPREALLAAPLLEPELKATAWTASVSPLAKEIKLRANKISSVHVFLVE